MPTVAVQGLEIGFTGEAQAIACIADGNDGFALAPRHGLSLPGPADLLPKPTFPEAPRPREPGLTR